MRREIQEQRVQAPTSYTRPNTVKNYHRTEKSERPVNKQKNRGRPMKYDEASDTRRKSAYTSKNSFHHEATTNQQVNHDGTSAGIVEAIRLVVATGIIIFPRQRQSRWSHPEPCAACLGSSYSFTHE